VREFVIRRAEEAILAHRSEVARVLALEPVPAPVEPLPGHPGGENGWELLRPALDALWELQTSYASSDDVSLDAPFGLGAVSDFERLRTESEPQRPHLDACRKGGARSGWRWQGPLDRELPFKTLLACKHLCVEGLLAWKGRRDKESFDWLFVALTLSQETVRLGQMHSHAMLRTVERAACELARLVFSSHGLSAAEVDEIRLRLDGLWSRRPSSLPELRWWCVEVCRYVLDDPAQIARFVGERDADWAVPRWEAGWKDWYSHPVRIARVLDGLRDVALDAGRLPWRSSSDLESGWEEICSRQRKEDVRRICLELPWYLQERAASVRRDLLRTALGVARFQAAMGRMPATAEEAGVAGLLARPVAVDAARNSMELVSPQGTGSPVDAQLGIDELVWTFRRR
jgi:hypothetical protein